MKENLKAGVSAVPLKGTTLHAVALHLAAAVCGLLCSQVKLLSSLTPLGVILSAAVPLKYSLTAATGSFFGYLFFGVSDTPFRYIAALFAAVSIRLLTAGIKKLSTTAPFCAVTVLVSVTVCNLVSCMSNSDNTLLLLCEGVLSGGLTYFLARTFEINPLAGVGLGGEELASVIISADMALLALVPVAVGGFSLGKVFIVATVLTAARFGAVSGGALAGTAVGFAAALSSNDAKLVCLYAIGGMIAGLFSSGGRVLAIVGFSIPAFISICVFGIDEKSFALIVEILLGIAVFLLLPKQVCTVIAGFFTPPVRLESLEGMRKSLVVRLKYASGALGDVSGTIEEVAKRLKRIQSPEPGDIFTGCEERACSGCSFRISCWETNRDETHRALGALADSIRKGGGTLEECAPEFAEKCLRAKTVESTLRTVYGEYLARMRAEERITQVRGVVSDQFDGISDMLLDLANEFDTSRHYDLDMAETVVGALREMGLLSTDCGCSVDKFGRVTIEAKLHNVGDHIINRKQLRDRLETACERRFEPPVFKKLNDILHMTVCERANITPEIGVTQLPAAETGICGDSYTTFGDGSGRFYMLLADGMGTGGAAAVDGAMTSGLMERLLKAGFGFDCSLRIVNSALLYKSTEESLSTVDIACVDLYTGETRLYKAGAAPTLIKRAGRVGRAESRSLPVGILRDVGFDRSVISLKREDIIVLLSDCACTDGTDWICHEIEEFQNGTAQQLSEKLAEAAQRRADPDHPDDITVMVTVLNKKL